MARLNGGAASVREYLPSVRSALKFLQTLRERTLAAGYQAASEAPQRFRGILGPSISHEGYASPTHSYWDDYWALKGWHDGAWLARQWQLSDMASWAADQGAAHCATRWRPPFAPPSRGSTSTTCRRLRTLATPIRPASPLPWTPAASRN